MTSDEIAGLVFAAFPKQYRRKLLQGSFAGHRDADRLAYATFADTEAENVVGTIRRGYVESNMRGAAELVSGLTTHVQRIPGTGWNYSEVRSERAVMVAKSVATPGGMIDKADYRDTLAQSNQLGFWEEEPSAAGLFVVLVHSRYAAVVERYASDERGLLGSAYLVCPTPGCDHYVWEWNLGKEFPEVVRASVPNTWDEEAVLRYERVSESALYRHAS
ncbi:MAG: hypothetical protein K8R99_02690 [Actinomycetia bacterium]|nr:hypothetical protein [Actinomycetes bacterium]